MLCYYVSFYKSLINDKIKKIKKYTYVFFKNIYEYNITSTICNK